MPIRADAEQAGADLHRAVAAEEPVDDQIVERLVLPLVDRAVPEWKVTLDELQSLPDIGGPAGYSGGVPPSVPAGGGRTAHRGRRSLRRKLRSRAVFDEARQVKIPLHVLLPWDDEGNDRQAAVDLFDAFASREKTLNANRTPTWGGHTGVPQSAGDAEARFFVRHLK